VLPLVLDEENPRTMVLTQNLKVLYKFLSICKVEIFFI